MTAAVRRRGSVAGALALGQGLALVLLAASFGWVMREIGFVFERHRILVSVGNESQFGPAVLRELAHFALAAWFVHALVGLLAVGLALLTESAFPRGLRARRGWLVTLWFLVLTGLVLAANTTLHPASAFSDEVSWWRQPVAGNLPVVLAGGAVLAMVLGLALKAVAGRRPGRAGLALAASALALLAAAGLALTHPLRTAGARVVTERPHVVILGLDSMRDDLEIPRRGNAQAPALRAFLARSLRFTDASTPLARTFPSWVSILTGRHPVATNARYNLMARRDVRERDTLGDSLRAQGYRAVYATDEVRFANIDASYGFDQVVTPPIGAADFLLGYAGDLPLVNLVARTRAGGWLFPTNHANRGAAITYTPDQFLERLEREISIQGPTFLSIHLTLAHWPYAWAGMAIPNVPEEYRDAYARAVSAVDAQFEAVLDMLHRKHVLDNAIVVVLSDHGEALGAQNDSLLRNFGSGTEVWNSLWGHGTSVMSPNQYRTLLALRAYGAARLPVAPDSLSWPVSLEDVRPTLEDFATGRVGRDLDGRSLLPYLAGKQDPAGLADRVRFTETDFNTPSTKAGRFAASGVFQEAASYYQLDQASGWIQLRGDRMAELLTHKERAAFTSGQLLAALPGASGPATRYVLTDRFDPHPRTLDGPPDRVRDPEARRLWDALHARFPGELGPVASLP